jgi:hypothetical protein
MYQRILSVLCMSFLLGCTMGYRNVGTSHKWQTIEHQIKIGVTTESDLLKSLGPPSLMDMRSMSGKTIYYYWMERLKNRSLYLLLYNYWDVDIKYDKAMFIFNKNGVLEYYGISYDAHKPRSKTREEE